VGGAPLTQTGICAVRQVIDVHAPTRHSVGSPHIWTPASQVVTMDDERRSGARQHSRPFSPDTHPSERPDAAAHVEASVAG
jgi:hypothetical protein